MLNWLIEAIRGQRSFASSKALQSPAGDARKARRASLQEAIDTPTSLEQLTEALPGCWVGVYADLLAFHPLLALPAGDGGQVGGGGHANTLREWLEKLPHRLCVVNFLWTDSYGHWFCIFIDSRDRIQIFDSTATYPDTLGSLPRREGTPLPEGENTKKIIAGLAGERAHYNDHVFQAKSAQTCARHVLMRLQHRDLNEDEYYLAAKNIATICGSTLDELAVFCTEPL